MRDAGTIIFIGHPILRKADVTAFWLGSAVGNRCDGRFVRRIRAILRAMSEIEDRMNQLQRDHRATLGGRLEDYFGTAYLEARCGNGPSSDRARK